MQDMGADSATQLDAGWASAGVLCAFLGNVFKKDIEKMEKIQK